MEITNKRILYQIEEISGEISLKGSISFSESKIIKEFSGEFIKKDEILGTFYYEETNEGLCSKNVNNVKIELSSELLKFLEDVILKIKNHSFE